MIDFLQSVLLVLAMGALLVCDVAYRANEKQAYKLKALRKWKPTSIRIRSRQEDEY